jgi:hypothetical protein
VASLRRSIDRPGRPVFEWEGTDESGSRVASGIYLYRLQAGEVTESRKMMLAK